MNVLITGGAGYIGSHVAMHFLDNDHDVTIIDNLKNGSKSLVPNNAKLVQSDISNKKKVSDLLAKNKFDIVVHLAAYTKVGESMLNPEKYYKNNYENSKIFFDLCVKFKITKFFFSSTGAVYGNTSNSEIFESNETKPINPYSDSKLKTEKYLKELTKIKSICAYVFRYFNVAGADRKLRSGLTTNPENLIKAVCEVATGKRDKLTINGNDYQTKDGTTIRDYIHVSDLADIHLLSSNKLMMSKQGTFEIFNCGYGVGYSIMDVVKEMNSISLKKIKYSIGPRREGDAVLTVANTDKFRKLFNWKPKFDKLNIILKTALEWEKKYKTNNFKQ